MRDAWEKGHDLLLDIDVQGAAQIKQKLPDAISIFVLPPDRKTLEWRLSNRGEDAPEVSFPAFGLRPPGVEIKVIGVKVETVRFSYTSN